MRCSLFMQSFLYQPTICRNTVCQNRQRFELDVDKSKFVDFQKVRIQETQAELPRGSIPRRYSIYIMFSKDQSHSFVKFCANELANYYKKCLCPKNIFSNDYFEGIMQQKYYSGFFIAIFSLRQEKKMKPLLDKIYQNVVSFFKIFDEIVVCANPIGFLSQQTNRIS